MLPVGRNAHRKLFSEAAENAGRCIGRIDNVRRDEVIFRSKAVGDRTVSVGKAAQQRIVPVYKDRTVRREKGEHLRLCPQDALPVPELCKMCGPDDGVNRMRGLYHLRKLRHFAKVADAHLDNGRFMLRRKPEQRQRDAKVVIEIFFRLQHVPARSEHRRDHFLGCGLSHASRNSVHRAGKPLPVGACQCPESLLHVRNDDDRSRHVLRNMLYQGAGRTGGKGGSNIGVPVRPGSGKGCEKASPSGAAAVYHHIGHRVFRGGPAGQSSADNV